MAGDKEHRHGPTVEAEEGHRRPHDNGEERERQKERRERLTRRLIEEATRLARSDASKTFRADVWRQALGQMGGMRIAPMPLFAGFGGGGLAWRATQGT